MAYNYTPSIFDDKPSILSQLQELKKTVKPIVGSETIVVDENEEGTALEIHLDYQVISDIDRSLKVPVATPAATQLVGIDTTRSQTNLTIGDGLFVEGNTVKAAVTHIINMYSDSFYVGANPDEGIYAQATFTIVDNNAEPITMATLAARMYAANYKAIPLQFANFPNGSYYGNCGIVVPSTSEYIIYASGDYVYPSQVVELTDTVIG